MNEVRINCCFIHRGVNCILGCSSGFYVRKGISLALCILENKQDNPDIFVEFATQQLYQGNVEEKNVPREFLMGLRVCGTRPKGKNLNFINLLFYFYLLFSPHKIFSSPVKLPTNQG